MKKGTKLNFAVFVLVALVSGLIFSVQTISAYQEIGEGQVAGVEDSQAQRRAELTFNYGENQKKLTAFFNKGANVLDIVKKAEQGGQISLSVADYDFGTLIEEIDGYKNGTDSRYWMYYVNGEMPMVGIDAYVLSAGDEVEFKFEKSQF